MRRRSKFGSILPTRFYSDEIAPLKHESCQTPYVSMPVTKIQVKSAYFLRPTDLVCKNIFIVPAGEIEFRARRQEGEAGVREMRAPFPLEARIEHGLDRVQVQDIAGSICKLLFRQLGRAPI